MPTLEVELNVELLRRRVPNLTVAASRAGLRAATVSRLCTGKTRVAHAEVQTLLILADLAGCTVDDLLVRDSSKAEGDLEAFIDRWAASGAGDYVVGGPRDEEAPDVASGVAAIKALPSSEDGESSPPLRSHTL